MKVVELFLLVLSLTVHGQCRDLWSADLPEVSDLELEKGKPLQLPKSYESVQIARLKGTLYADSLSQLQGVKELRIKNHELTAIEKGALCSGPDVKILEIDFYESKNSLTHLTKEMFGNCDNLEELLLKFDSEKNIYTIDNDAFEDLKNLKNFVLSAYPLNHLTKNFFKLTPSLTRLTLSSVNITEVDANALEEISNLKDIDIRFNKNWTHLPQELLKNLLNLERVLLRENALTDLTWDEFRGLTKVKILDLSANHIKLFDAEKIANNLPNLEELRIHLNPVPCKELEAFVEDLKKRINHPIHVQYKFDPGYYDPCKHDM